MIYLSGKQVEHPRIGLMLSFNGAGYKKKKREMWAADNGCYTRPDKYDDSSFLNWLDDQERENCLFATAPDVV